MTCYITKFVLDMTYYIHTYGQSHMLFLHPKKMCLKCSLCCLCFTLPVSKDTNKLHYFKTHPHHPPQPLIPLSLSQPCPRDRGIRTFQAQSLGQSLTLELLWSTTHIPIQAGAELGQAQLQLELDFTLIKVCCISLMITN